MQVVDLLYNDTLAQFYKGYHLKDEIKEKRIEQVKNCNHVFVCTDIDDLSPVIECIHCGLNNRTLNYYHKFMRYVDKNKIPHELKNLLPFEAKLFMEELPSFFSRQDNNLDRFNLLSDEIIRTFHASVLYQAAREINNQDDDHTLFEIMKSLNSLETEFERVKIEKKEDTYELVSRYSKKILAEKEKVLRK